ASIRRYAFDYSSVAQSVFDDARTRGSPVYVIGGPEGVAREAAPVILHGHPDYQSAIDEASRASIVIVGMGVPAQEKFLADLWSHGWRGAGYTCGGFLEQIVGTDGEYFPPWSNR